MKALKATILELVILGGVAVVVALTANGVRAKGSLQLTKNYFRRALVTPPNVQGSESQGAQLQAAVSTKPSPTQAAAGGNEKTADAEDHPEHGFQVVSLARAVEVFNDPNTAMGANLFVDARDNDAYEEGHIPGAIQANHYEIEEQLEDILQLAQSAERVIVYCNGGDCEDSILVCGDLMEAGVSYDNIYLFAGGWKAWTADAMPVAEGRDAEGE